MAIAKYEEIKQDIVKRILSKEFQPGQKISSEADLKSKYDTSRMTINITIAAMSTQRSFLFKMS